MRRAEQQHQRTRHERQFAVMRLISLAALVLFLSHAYAVFGVAPVMHADQGGDQNSSPKGAMDGQAIFRFDTFGDEQLWTETLRMHEVVATMVSPLTALGVGLKVDVQALPPTLIEALKTPGGVDLTSPAVTV